MDSDEYLRQQKLAADRVKNMQKRAEAFTAPPEKEKPPAQISPAPPMVKQRRGNELLRILDLKNMEMNSDRALIVGMMMLLLSEGDDELLNMALLYIML